MCLDKEFRGIVCQKVLDESECQELGISSEHVEVVDSFHEIVSLIVDEPDGLDFPLGFRDTAYEYVDNEDDDVALETLGIQ